MTVTQMNTRQRKRAPLSQIDNVTKKKTAGQSKIQKQMSPTPSPKKSKKTKPLLKKTKEEKAVMIRFFIK
jgi:hypothetical protein